MSKTFDPDFSLFHKSYFYVFGASLFHKHNLCFHTLTHLVRKLYMQDPKDKRKIKEKIKDKKQNKI
jgi:hypothetical protein